MEILIENISSIDHSFVFCTVSLFHSLKGQLFDMKLNLQHCHHGGHYVHLKEWFRDYNICPASGCDCKCSTRDGALLDDDLTQKSSKISKNKIIKNNIRQIQQHQLK